jgi:curli biogenesis system outer membrane secretion channel CsgG
MKKLALLAIVISSALAASARADAPATPADAAAGGLRFSITVTKFENHSGYSGSQFNLSDTWGEMLTDSLMQTGKFIVLGEADMRQAAMQEQDFAAGGRTAGGDKTPVKGNMTPAQLLVKGVITNFQTASPSAACASAAGETRPRSTRRSTSWTRRRVRWWPRRRSWAP